jgi:hypothetical protein
MPLTDIGTGTSIVFVTSGFDAEFLSVDWSGIARGVVDSSHLLTVNWRTFIPTDLVDPGEIQVEMAFDPSDQPPLHELPERIIVTFPVPAGLVTPANWQGDGFMSGFEFNVPLEDKMTGTGTLKMTGEVFFTAAA